MKEIWIVDDERDILNLYQELFELYGCKNPMHFFSHFDDEGFSPRPGDIVLHDLVGVGEVKKFEDVEYFVCSGSHMNDDEIDYLKPNQFDTMIVDIMEKL